MTWLRACQDTVCVCERSLSLRERDLSAAAQRSAPRTARSAGPVQYEIIRHVAPVYETHNYIRTDDGVRLALWSSISGLCSAPRSSHLGHTLSFVFRCDSYFLRHCHQRRARAIHSLGLHRPVVRVILFKLGSQ